MRESTYVLVPGAGSGPAFWSLVAPLLEARGHTVLTPAGASTDTIVAAAAGAEDVVLVADSSSSRNLAGERLGVEPAVVEARHCAALARPAELVERLEALRTAQAAVRG